MTVYHMSGDGTPKVCKALKKCPLGGEHFNSLPEAKAYAELQMAAEAGKLEKNSVEEAFTVAQRRRMWVKHPKMSYVHPVGTLLISKRGDLWELVKREQTGGPFDHKFTLKNTRSGKLVVVNADYNRKDSERSPDEFAQLQPHYFKVDGPPIKEGTKLADMPGGTLHLSNIVLAKIRVRTVENELDKELPRPYNEFGERDKEEERRMYGRELEQPSFRYLVVPNATEGDVQNKDTRLEFSKALWAQAGRDLESWEELTAQEQFNLFNSSKCIKEASFYTKNGTTNFVNRDLGENSFDSFWLPGGIPTSNVSLFKQDD